MNLFETLLLTLLTENKIEIIDFDLYTAMNGMKTKTLCDQAEIVCLELAYERRYSAFGAPQDIF